ncbi:LysR family transcriptional regulator [Acidithiobacillus acidisediminis]|uniref:LysR family transcriptional regulator n=1 Tax=Acidithiobacillus TaxID=119977 RepID=UPI002010B377|nr:LysR family transcriptional regulator [Acidithiobacillus sp. S30A2]
MDRRLDPSLLLIWAQAARAGNLHQAAERLFLTQPAVSHRLKLLQERVGEPLYRRTHRGISPTPMGIALWRIAERIEVAVAEASNLCTDSQGLLTGTAHLAASQSNAEVLLPRVLAQFHHTYPAIHLQVCSLNSRQARQSKEEYDLVFVEDDLPATEQGVWVQETLVETEIDLIVPANHPWAHTETAITLEDLEAADLIWREPGSGIREAVLQASKAAGISLAIRYEFSGLAAIREGVRSGLGFGFASRYHANLAADLRLLPLSPPIPHRLSVLHRTDASPATLALLQTLRSHLQTAEP